MHGGLVLAARECAAIYISRAQAAAAALDYQYQCVTVTSVVGWLLLMHHD